eukprot:11917451-Alexandrium_andersonii.AAC.1
MSGASTGARRSSENRNNRHLARLGTPCFRYKLQGRALHRAVDHRNCTVEHASKEPCSGLSGLPTSGGMGQMIAAHDL